MPTLSSYLLFQSVSIRDFPQPSFTKLPCLSGLYWRIHSLDLISSAIFFVALTGVSTYFMAMAYKNTKFSLKFKIASKREDAVTREVMRALAEDKKMSKKEKDERVLWKKNEVADYESTTFAIFYNNALYLAIIIFLSFFFFKNTAPAINYIFTIGISSGLLALLSTATPKN